MQASEYQERTKTFAIYPQHQALEYLALGLVSEAGEVAGKVKKFIRDKTDVASLAKDLSAELGDVCWYISQLCNTFGLDLEEVLQDNITKLASRAERGKIQGSGDER